MKISFIILNYNRCNELLHTLEKTFELMKAYPAFEVIVVDNASADDSVKQVKAQYAGVKLIERKQNNGVAGWNDGFAAAQGEYLVVLDDDSNVESGLEDAIQFLDLNKQIGVLALNVTGGAFETTAKDNWIDKQESIGFIGCGAIIRKNVVEQIGGFAEWLFIYTHEYEYGLRVMNAGYKITYFENCVVKHRTSVINRTNKRLKVFSARNEMAIVYKFFSRKTRWFYILRVFLNNFKGVYRYGLPSVGWYYEALNEFFKIRKKLHHTPVSKEVQDIYKKAYWSTRPFLNLL